MQDPGSTFFRFERRASHNAWLDFLRSFAVFLVLLRHGSRVSNNSLPHGFVSNFFANGWVGVDLFFVLSGYLIAIGLIRRFASNESLFVKGYFRDRMLRIVPAYYVVLFLCLLGFFPGFQIQSRSIDQSLIYHLFFLQDYTGSDINVAFWSLGVEEKFYIVAPAFVLIFLRSKGMIACTALSVSLLLISPFCRGLAFENINHVVNYPEFFYLMRSPFHMSLEGFIIGTFVALLQSKGIAFSNSSACLGLGASAVVLALWLGSHDFYANITRFDVWLQPTVLVLLFGFMVFCAISLASQRLLFEPFFRCNARLSYVLYLVHYPLIPLAVFLGRGKNLTIFWVSYLLLAYSAALLLHFGVEKPFLILKEKISMKGKTMGSVNINKVSLP